MSAVRTIQRCGETWLVEQTRRGWKATCPKLDLDAKAETLEALMAAVDELFETLCV